MSEIKLTEQPTDSEITGVVPDLDESNSSFNRLSFVLQNSGQKFYFQLNKEDSADLIIKKGDELYVEEDNVNYLKNAYCINEYEKRIHFVFRSAIEGIDVPSEWKSEIQGVPKSAAMYDDVYVNKEIVKIDYAAGVQFEKQNEMQELIEKVNAKFPNEVSLTNNPYNVIGKYLDNHTIRPPYTSQNTVTAYHMYYDKSWFQELLTEYKCPNYNYKYCFWFGFKYDLDATKRYLKVVIRDNDMTSNYQANPDSFILRPQLPHCSEPYYAKIYSEDGTEADEYDVFFTTTPDIMEAYCEKNGLDFPIPQFSKGDFIWTYGLVYDKRTLEIKQVKGYIKRAQIPLDYM